MWVIVKKPFYTNLLSLPKMDTWVQCSLCQKWRRVDDNVAIPTDRPWKCRFNLFDPAHNRCDHVQESMPDGGAADAEGPDLELDEVVSEDLVVLDEDPTEPFQPSSCTCSHCVETNWAVKHWRRFKESTEATGAMKIIIDAVDATEMMALTAEDTKQFIHGVVTDLHNPPVAYVPARFRDQKEG